MLYAFEAYTLDTDRRELRRGDALIPLQPQVFDLLAYLVRERDHVASKDDLIESIWNGRIVSDSTLASRVNAARTAIGDNGEDQRLIRTLPRKGFRFVGEVVEKNPAAFNGIRASSGEADVDRDRQKPWQRVSPYRGLAAMKEEDSNYFFGRDREVSAVIDALANEPERLPLLVGNSGVGKSSLAQAGVIAALRRRSWPAQSGLPRPWPRTLKDSHRWTYFRFKPGARPVAALVEAVLGTWQLDPLRSEWRQCCGEWTEKLTRGHHSLGDLLDATKQRYAELQRSEPAAFFFYVDQGEELYVRADLREARRLSQLLAETLGHAGCWAMMSLRADFFGELQKDETLYAIHRQINVPPLREVELREVVSRPATLLEARFESEHLPTDIARRAAEESAEDACVLPLLSYLLDDMWSRMVARNDGVLRLPGESIELGGVLVHRADAFLESHPNSGELLRRIFTLRLATVREGEEPTRRRARRDEFSDGEWRLVNDLADHPYRLIVTATPDIGQPYAEVAHEAVFRRWDRLQAWIAAEREFLAWKSGVEAARRAWEAAPEPKNDALLMGLALARAEDWLAKRSADIPADDRDFIARSAAAKRRRARRFQAVFAVLGAILATGAVGWANQGLVSAEWRQVEVIRPYRLTQVQPYILSATAEAALKPGDSFKECAAHCPEMVVVPAGRFIMGSPATERGHTKAEEPLHTVTIAAPFAVSKFEVTFDDWDTCASYGDCDPNIPDSRGQRGAQPVINVNWQDAQTYLRWLSRMTGKAYRLLSEAEFEYAARGGTTTAYYWDDGVGMGHANCTGCGTEWDGKQAAPVGTFPPNPFGLYDMEGNVWQWVEDCMHPDYTGAPADGSAWMESQCSAHVLRAGSWLSRPLLIRNANHIRPGTGDRGTAIGFRIARTLARPRAKS